MTAHLLMLAALVGLGACLLGVAETLRYDRTRSIGAYARLQRRVRACEWVLVGTACFALGVVARGWAA